jgi:hypothetical protein
MHVEPFSDALHCIALHRTANCAMHFYVLALVPAPMGTYTRDLDKNPAVEMSQIQFCAAVIFSYEDK